MCGIGFRGEHFAAAVVVETDHAPAVKVQRLGDTDLLDLVIAPRSVGVAERRKAAVGADTGAGEDNEFFHGMDSYAGVKIRKLWHSSCKIQPM